MRRLRVKKERKKLGDVSQNKARNQRKWNKKAEKMVAEARERK